MNTGDALKTRKKVSKIPKNDLAEWTEKYLKNRDIITCLIQSMEKNKDGWDIIVHAKNADKFYSVMPSIENFDEIEKEPFVQVGSKDDDPYWTEKMLKNQVEDTK